MGNHTLSILLSSVSLFAACAVSPADELAGDEAGDAGKADDAGEHGFYKVRRLVQRCPGAECQGLGIAAVNKTSTTCLDGTRTESCYVPDPFIDWSATRLDEAQLTGMLAALPYGLGASNEVPVLLRGERRGETFAVTEVWMANPRAAQAEGVFVRVKSKEIACNESPCHELRESKLNSTLTAVLGDLELDTIATDPLEQAMLQELLQDPDSPGVIIAGERTELADGAKSRSISQYWIRVTNDE
jgi:hypothetical protein